jgi:hypothetical protein
VGLLRGGARCGAATVHWCQARTTGELQGAVSPGAGTVRLLWPCRMECVCVPFLADLSHYSHACLLALRHCEAGCQLAAGLVGSHCPGEDTHCHALDARVTRVILLGDESRVGPCRW